jgi:hypothetical protein
MKKIITSILILLVGLFILNGCNEKTPQPPALPEETQQSSSEEISSPPALPEETQQSSSSEEISSPPALPEG